MRLQDLVFYNRAPFDNLRMSFGNESTIILSGINGSGKTTVISHIVDAFYELAKKAYRIEFENKANKYYRVSSSLFNMDKSKLSAVYLRFVGDEDEYYDYIDLRGECTEEEYLKVIEIQEKIPFQRIEKDIKKNGNVKYWSITESKDIQRLFENNILTYFPAYRYENPFYLNDPYKVSLSFQKDMRFFGYLPNSIEVTSDLQEISNWMMDVVLDMKVNDNPPETIKLFTNINAMISQILSPKINTKVRLGIGLRNSGAARIAIMSKDENKQVYPSIFGMSSGELALLCLFGELIKQADSIDKEEQNVAGIVLIDEIDKHLHIRLQKEILPKLIQMFPKLQFIVTSHSPFFSLGLEENPSLTYQIRDMEHHGINCSPRDNLLFEEAYDVMLEQNLQYRKHFQDFQNRYKDITKPLIITEGKTDWMHLEAAKKALKITDLNVEFCEFTESKGDDKLKKFLYDLSSVEHTRKIIAIFDRDNADKLQWPELFAEEYIHLSPFVFAFAVPIVNSNEYGQMISIEHYYKRKDLTKLDKNNRRIFLGDEFYETGFSKDGIYHTKCKDYVKRVRTNGVIDDRVYANTDYEEKHSIALSKNDFATYIYQAQEYAKEFDFSCFRYIFELIKKIIDGV